MGSSKTTMGHYVCGRCGKAFSSILELRAHERTCKILKIAEAFENELGEVRHRQSP